MKYSIGIDLGGTNIKSVLINQKGKIIFDSIRPTQADKNRETVINNIENSIIDLLNKASDIKDDIIGVGIGTPGIVDDGIVLGGAENLPDWEDLNLVAALSNKLNIPICVDNDANMMGLGEVRFGKVNNVSDVIFLTIGTGIGGAMVLNGKLYGGYRNRGAELGCIIIDANQVDSSNSKGYFESLASVTALINDYKKILSSSGITINDKIDGRYIVKEYLKNQPEAIMAMNNHFDYLAKGVVSLINIFSPQEVIIGGGISESGIFYIEEIRKRVFSMVMKETSVFTKIKSASLGNNAGAMGAAACVFDLLK